MRPLIAFLFLLWVLALMTLAAFVMVSAVALLVGPASAHDAPMGWQYPLSCCSNKDCRETAEAEIIETRDGYQVASTGEVVPYGDRRIKEISQDGKIHVCQQGGNFDAGRVLCLLIPPRSF